MKRIFLFSIITTVCVFATFNANGQNMPVYSQYNFNPFVINPSMAGIEEGQFVNLSYRSQFTHFPTAPINRMLTYSGQFNNTGLGVMLYNNVAGSLEYNGGMAAYSYKIPLTPTSNLSLGLSMQFFRLQLRPSESAFNNLDMSDPIIIDAMNGTNTIESSFGAYYSNDNGWYIGTSLPNLIQTQLGGTIVENGGNIGAQFLGFTGYKFNTKNLTIDPSIIIRKLPATPLQLEFNGKVWFLDETLMLGSYYRSGENALAFLLGVNIEDTFHLSYAYEASFNELSNYHTGSHIFMVGLFLNNLSKKEVPVIE